MVPADSFVKATWQSVRCARPRELDLKSSRC